MTQLEIVLIDSTGRKGHQSPREVTLREGRELDSTTEPGPRVCLAQKMLEAFLSKTQSVCFADNLGAGKYKT